MSSTKKNTKKRKTCRSSSKRGSNGHHHLQSLKKLLKTEETTMKNLFQKQDIVLKKIKDCKNECRRLLFDMTLIKEYRSEVQENVKAFVDDNLTNDVNYKKCTFDKFNGCKEQRPLYSYGQILEVKTYGNDPYLVHALRETNNSVWVLDMKEINSDNRYGVGPHIIKKNNIHIFTKTQPYFFK